MVKKALAFVKKENDRQYFFTRLQNPLWVKPLKERGYFASPPPIRKLSDHSVQLPWWPELRYLKNVAKNEPEDVVEILLKIPQTNNTRICEDIIDIALELSGEHSAKLESKILEYFDTDYYIAYSNERCSNLLMHWTQENQIKVALNFTKELIKFSPDSDNERRRKKNPGYDGILEPRTMFSDFEYRQILEKGVSFLTDKEPFQVANLLIDEVDRMIEMREIYERKSYDKSRIWCATLRKEKGFYNEPKRDLVHAMTYACEKTYEQMPDSVAELDGKLREKHWRIFQRVRQHLYSFNVNEQTKPWILDFVLSHQDYGVHSYSSEFQKMIRCACEHFGYGFLPEEKRAEIFERIINGPSKKEFRDSMGDNCSEEKFIKQQKHLHKCQLTPFKNVLYGKYLTYFQSLTSSKETLLADKDYVSGRVVVGAIKDRSPKSRDELAKLSDEEILNFVNEWEDTHRDTDDWFVEINIRSLASEFQMLLEEEIIQDNSRFRFWINHREQIRRPIYVRSFIQAFQERIKSGNLEKIDQCFDLCEWVLSHESQSGEFENEKSFDTPDWSSSRFAVGDLISECLKENVKTPLSKRERLAKLLELLCTQYDWRLDEQRPVLIDGDSSLDEAINNTRCRALETLVSFGWWIRKHSGENSNVQEVTQILETRRMCAHPLTLPEYAILGSCYQNIYLLDKQWASDNKSFFFPQGNLCEFIESFGNFLDNNPWVPIVDVVRNELEFTLENLDEIKKQESKISRMLVNGLGCYLFDCYLLEECSIGSQESLLNKYYQKTEKKYWAKLFYHTGKHTGEKLDEKLKKRVVEFFDWRLTFKDQDELHEFAFWMKAECLDVEWRLKSLLSILNIVKDFEDIEFSILTESLCEMLESNPSLVVECFAGLTGAIDKTTYVRVDQARIILNAGLKDENPEVRNNAEQARENLLRRGHFDFLNMED